VDLAMLETDRQLAANGITTALHGVTHSWEGGLRGRESALQLIDALGRLRHRLQVEHKVHLRFECHNLAGEADAVSWLHAGQVSLLAFNDHLPGMRRKPHKWQEWADRAHTDVAGFESRLAAAAEGGDEVPGLIARLSAHARRLGIPMASHDDHAIERRDFFDGVSCRISEFPLNREVAEHACSRGSAVVCGGPNILRGSSHVGAPRAADLAADRLCTILASDYYYPAPLHAAFQLAGQGLLPLHEAWALVSTNPAAALLLADRGAIEVGRRADLIVVDAHEMASPRLIATICAGKIAYLADGTRLHD
jgi:alpha-D-ribose 1-methylphosphonate 5-triphosphate diphosphatase